MEDVYNIEIDKSRYADGGMMAKGGKIEPIKLYKVGEMEDGTIRLQSQLYIGKDTSDFIIENGVIKNYSIGEKGFNFYEYKEPYIIVDDISMMKNQPFEKGGMTKKKTKGIDLFEDYQDIPPKVQKVLDKYQEDIEDGDYKGLEKALKELEKIGYTFEYGLDGIAYDLRPIGTKGKSEFMEF